MPEPISLPEIKTHLRLDTSETGEDSYLETLIIAARRTIEAQINRSVGEADFAADDVIVVAQAIRLVVGSWYANREAVITGTIATELPLAVAMLLGPLRRMPSPPLPAPTLPIAPLP